MGASQVQPYVSRLAARGVPVEVLCFEPSVGGAVGGLGRVLLGARAVRSRELVRSGLVHARAHMAGASCVLGRPRRWLWDVRSLWVDERIESGMLRRGSPEERVLRRLERRSALACDAVVTLSAAAVPALSALCDVDVSTKATVIPTCVDLERFSVSPLPEGSVVRLLLSGSLNALYDVPTMLRFASAVGGLRPVSLERVGGGGSPWEAQLADVSREELPFSQMPGRLASAHAGLCVQFRSVSAVAAAPIKVAEFLACGRPVVVSEGLGDMPALVRSNRCGVVVGHGADDVDAAAEELCVLLEDPELPSRCRAVAERHFDLEWAVDQLVGIYAALTDA